VNAEAFDAYLHGYHFFQGGTDKALEWLDRAYAQRDPSLMSTKIDPLLKSLHSDPRFTAFLKKLNLPA
jgi:hypothetical protein